MIPERHDQELLNNAESDGADEAKSSPAVDLESDIVVHTNHGKVVGLEVETIKGDVRYTHYGTSVQIIALTEGSRQGLFTGRFDREKSPYPGNEPFTFDWRNLFFGRTGKIAEALRGTTNHPLVVLAGPPRSGKTSLLNAGIIPEVTHFGGLVARIDQYNEPAAALREALSQVEGPLADAVRSAGTLSEVTRAATRAGGGTFLLVLDQFERIFDLPKPSQERFVNDLHNALAEDPERLLRIMLSIRTDEDNERQLAALQEAIPGLLNYRVELAALTYDEARQALEHPLLKIDGPVQFASPLVRERVLDDLARLSGTSRTIDPTALQLVGTCLFERARQRLADENVAPVISMEVYGNGAAAILEECIRDTYDQHFADTRELVDAVLYSLIVHQDDGWIARHEIGRADGADQQLDVVLRRLVDEGLLIRRHVQYDEYTFLNPTIAATLSRLAGENAQQARRARQMLASAWTEWDVLRVPARKAQIRFLSTADGDVQPDWQQSLLLLRSAVHHREDPRQWLSMLTLQIDHLKALSAPSAEAQLALSEIELVDLDRSTPRDSEQEPLARIAARDDDRVDRETAALTLAAVESMNPVAIETRLRPAFISTPNTLRQRWRRAGLWGALTDVGVSLNPIRHAFGPHDRLLIWADRAARRISRNQRSIWMKAGGMAVGMGLGLGILRALIAPTTTYSWQLELSTNFLWAALAGLVMGLAIQVTTAILDGVADWRVVAAGAIGFGLGHLWIMSGNDLEPLERPLTAGLGFAWGAVLATAVAYSRTARRAAWAGWVAAAGISFGLMQALLNQTKGPLEAFPLVRNGVMFYASQWDQETRSLVRLLRDWLDRIAVIDAALVGCALMIGLLVGTRLAERWFAAWQDLEAKAGS